MVIDELFFVFGCAEALVTVGVFTASQGIEVLWCFYFFPLHIVIAVGDLSHMYHADL